LVCSAFLNVHNRKTEEKEIKEAYIYTGWGGLGTTNIVGKLIKIPNKYSVCIHIPNIDGELTVLYMTAMLLPNGFGWQYSIYGDELVTAAATGKLELIGISDYEGNYSLYFIDTANYRNRYYLSCFLQVVSE